LGASPALRLTARTTRPRPYFPKAVMLAHRSSRRPAGGTRGHAARNCPCAGY
jgi:hypothetical protein